MWLSWGNRETSGVERLRGGGPDSDEEGVDGESSSEHDIDGTSGLKRRRGGGPDFDNEDVDEESSSDHDIDGKMNALLSSTAHLTENSQKRLKTYKKKCSRPEVNKILEWEEGDMYCSASAYRKAASLLNVRPGKALHFTGAESLKTCLDALHLFQLFCEERRNNQDSTLMKYNETLCKLIGFVLNIGLVRDPSRLLEPGGLFWILDEKVLSTFEALAVTAGRVKGSTCNKKPISGGGLAFRKTFFSNLQGMFQCKGDGLTAAERVLYRYTDEELFSTKPANLSCSVCDVKEELKARFKTIGHVCQALSNGAGADIAESQKNKRKGYKPETGGWDMMSDDQFARLWDHCESELMKLMHKIRDDGYTSAGASKSSTKVLDRWNCLMGIYLLIQAGQQDRFS